MLQSPNSYLELFINPTLGLFPTITTEGVETPDDDPLGLFVDLDGLATINDGINIVRLESSDSDYPIEVWYPRVIASFPVSSPEVLTVPPLWTRNTTHILLY